MTTRTRVLLTLCGAAAGYVLVGIPATWLLGATLDADGASLTDERVGWLVAAAGFLLAGWATWSLTARTTEHSAG